MPRAHTALICAGLFLLALLPRWYSAQALGWDWDYPGSFTLVNFDEGGSCRAALEGFSYSSFVGRQTIAIAGLAGHGPPEGIAGKERAVKAYCHSAEHILLARTYSAILGALTVVAVALLTLQLVPSTPAVAWTAAALLALSGFHISESQSATVDVPSVFFIYSFLALLAWAQRRPSRWGVWLSPALLLPAVWAKYWVFAIFAYLAWLPRSWWDYISGGLSAPRIAGVIIALAVFMAAVTNAAFPRIGLLPLVALYAALIPWMRIPLPMRIVWLALPLGLWSLLQVDLIAAYTQSGEGGRFGTAYGAIGENKWLRNLVNIPAVLIVGLGIPACLFIPAGLLRIFRGGDNVRCWLVLLPVLAFLLFMAFLAPVTYYRHYLALLPAAAIVAALGLFSTVWSGRRVFLFLFFAWPALLAYDLVSDYHSDPRIELRRWYAQHPQARVFISYYVNPPPAAASRSVLFRPEYARGDAAGLKRATYLILSENWYDTAFANELNGPSVHNLGRLIKTRPEYARFYRRALANEDPNLQLEESLDLQHFMPELLLHRRWYGNFSLFVGDMRIFRVLQ